MSKTIETKLKTVYSKLDTNKQNLLKSKKSLADALRFNGITNVTDAETFERYADLIRRLKSANAMMLQFTIPDTANTAYKKTVVLPMYFNMASNRATSGNDHTANINAIAKEIIENDPTTFSLRSKSKARAVSDVEEDDHLIEDMYGNIITDGNYVAPFTMEDVQEYLTEEQQDELLETMDNLGVSLMSLDEETNDGIMMLSDDDEPFEISTSETYSYRIDWGDGSGEFIFDHRKTYAENKGAIWHTYETPGIYEVSINGTFKRMYSNPTSWNAWVVNGEIVKDTDGSTIYSNKNYNMQYGLTSVVAWGNTLLTNMASAFCYCERLREIPMYDTTNSFSETTDFSNCFYRCSALTSLPFNANTNKGLFSGCKKATTFASCFAYCTGIKTSIPVKLIDGCPNVTSVANMFGYAGFTGGIPVGLLEGMTALTNASEMFASCNLTGELSPDLFKDCPNITTISRLFYNCKSVTGTLQKDFIGGLSKLTDMRQAFYGCTGITGFVTDAFYNIKSDGINCRDAFYGCSGITAIPSGLLSAMTGKNLMMERMFGNCVNLTSLADTSIANLKVANARGMFGGCTKLASALPSANPDWNTLEGMSRWYGAFAKTALSDIDTVCIELGGNGGRKFPESNVGKIALKDGSFVEGKEYVYKADNKPLGIVYADVYLDTTKMIPTLANSAGNVVSKDSPNAKRRIYVTVFNDVTKPWTNGQVNAENITTITDTSDVNVAYNKYTWGVGDTPTLNATRYNGEAYTKAINDWRVSKNMAVPVGGVYTKTDTDKYDAVDYVMSYNGVEGTNVQQLGDKIKPFLPDAADLWDQFTMKYFIQKMIDYVIAQGNGYTSANCISMRDGAYYWASAEGSQTLAWLCYTYGALCSWNDKWYSLYVRPSLAIDAA